MSNRTTSPAFYEERIRLMEAECQRLRDALKRIQATPVGDGYGMRMWDIADTALDGTPSAAQTLEDA
jgi:hypothetical protein